MASAKKNESALTKSIDKLEKAHGKGIIFEYGSAPRASIETISSGSFGLDVALGVGGYPRGRIVEVFGPESSGKTTLTLHAIAAAQQAGHKALFVDAEHAFDPKYAQVIGVDVDRLFFSQPDNGEQALEVVEEAVDSGAFGIIVIDSVAALVPRAEIEGEMGDSHVGLQARLMSQALRKLTGKVSKSNTIVFFINQIRMKIGVVYGSPETTTGGNALKFYASQRLDIRKIGTIKKGDQPIGQRTKIKVIKNKVAPPFKTCEISMYGKGFDVLEEICDFGIALGIIEKSGAWYNYGERKAHGKDNLKVELAADPEALEAIKTAIHDMLKSTLPDPAPVSEDGEDAEEVE